MSEGRYRNGPLISPVDRGEGGAEQAEGVSSDTLLAAWTHGRDEAAFAELFRRHYPRVYQVLSRLVGDEADDLAQQAFLALYQRPPRAMNDDVGAWLYRVATRLGYNSLRAARRRQRHQEALLRDPNGAGWQSADPAPEAWAEQRETQHLVRAALARLPERQAALLSLHGSGCSYREIAAALQMAPGSVGTTLARAERTFERVYNSLLGQRQARDGT